MQAFCELTCCNLIEVPVVGGCKALRRHCPPPSDIQLGHDAPQTAASGHSPVGSRSHVLCLATWRQRPEYCSWHQKPPVC